MRSFKREDGTPISPFDVYLDVGPSEIARIKAARHTVNPERLQKRCPDCFGTGRVDFGDDTPMTCQLCGGDGMLP